MKYTLQTRGGYGDTPRCSASPLQNRVSLYPGVYFTYLQSAVIEIGDSTASSSSASSSESSRCSIDLACPKYSIVSAIVLDGVSGKNESSLSVCQQPSIVNYQLLIINC
jgi:hypothetical protein